MTLHEQTRNQIGKIIDLRIQKPKRRRVDGNGAKQKRTDRYQREFRVNEPRFSLASATQQEPGNQRNEPH